MSVTPAIELIGITKPFPGVVANDGITFSVMPAEIHALVGENGAGQAALMKIIYGMQRPDAGEIRLDGKTVNFRSPKDAIAAGIGMVHQHFMLVDNFTGLENNCALLKKSVRGPEPVRGPPRDLASARQRIKELGTTYGLHVDPDRLA